MSYNVALQVWVDEPVLTIVKIGNVDIVTTLVM